MYLKLYNDTYQTLIDNYCLSKIKLRYVREPKIAIALTKKDPLRHAVLVFENEHLVAFFTLFESKGSSTYSDNKHNLLVQDLSTDFRHLRNGYVKQAVQLLPTFIHQHFSNINQLTLIINEDKAFTKAFCFEAGFKNISHELPHIYGSQILLQFPI